MIHNLKLLVEGFIAGGLTVWCVYHFNLQPKLKAERDALLEKLRK